MKGNRKVGQRKIRRLNELNENRVLAKEQMTYVKGSASVAAPIIEKTTTKRGHGY